MPRSTELDHAREQHAYWTAVVHYLEHSQPTPRPQRTQRQNGRVTAAQAAEEALRGHEGPMRTPDILHAVQAAGAKMKDTDGMYKTLDRDKARFRKAGRGLWELARPDQEG